MKFKISKWFIAATVLGAVLLASAARAQDTQGLPQTFIAITNQPSVVAAGATSNLNSWVQIRNGQALALTWRFNQATAGTSNCTVNVYTSVDGTNVSTLPWCAITAAATGATDVCVNTNWSAQTLSGYQDLIISNIVNSPSITTMTNKLLIIRRPNS